MAACLRFVKAHWDRNIKSGDKSTCHIREV